jgi:hypothetical protein
MGSWKRLGRRWIVILSAMLCGNLFLIVLAVAGFDGATPSSGAGNNVVAVGQQRDETALVSEAVVSEEAKPQPALTEQNKTAEVTEITATVGPVSAAVELAKTDSLVQTESQEHRPSEQKAAPETPKMVRDNVVPPLTETFNTVVYEGETVIANPPTTGGTVHFIVEGRVYSLPAGTYRRFAGKDPKRVLFHRGDDESDAEHELSTGSFAFAVGSAGWELAPVKSEDSQKVLRGCRLTAE